jgi:hypothetical protein
VFITGFDPSPFKRETWGDFVLINYTEKTGLIILKFLILNFPLSVYGERD